jgi:hypothetical protein
MMARIYGRNILELCIINIKTLCNWLAVKFVCQEDVRHQLHKSPTSKVYFLLLFLQICSMNPPGDILCATEPHLHHLNLAGPVGSFEEDVKQMGVKNWRSTASSWTENSGGQFWKRIRSTKDCNTKEEEEGGGGEGEGEEREGEGGGGGDR